MRDYPAINPDQLLVTRGRGPLIATALHSGHNVRGNLLPLFAVSEADRLREEDPGTDRLASLAPKHVIGQKSRFEVDLNRPRPKAVYLQPSDAWGLTVWRTPPSPDVIEASLLTYDTFYQYMDVLLTDLVKVHGKVVLIDFHSYNHRRGGPDAPPAAQEGNPDIDVEIDPMSRQRWSEKIDRLVEDVRQMTIDGLKLDVRERIRFQPGHFVCWVNERFPESVCAVAIEVKKFYMNEWTGSIDEPVLADLRAGFAEILPRMLPDLVLIVLTDRVA